MKTFAETRRSSGQLRLAVLCKALAVILAGGLGTAQAASVGGQGTWETTLQGRDLDGNASNYEAYYDKALNITWLANANAGAGSSYDNGSSNTDGLMTWQNAVNWAAGLSYTVGSTVYDDWRLPFVTDTGTAGCNFASSGTDCGYNVQTKDGSTVYSELGTCTT
jgi:hypothetical protein